MKIPRVIHRIWIGSEPTSEMILNIIKSRQSIYGNAELWLWTKAPDRPRLSFDNIKLCDLDSLWPTLSAIYPQAHILHSAFERECHGHFHNYASASDIARLAILYCYGGLYLDMDVSFLNGKNHFFNDAKHLGQRLGVMTTPNNKIGNGVLASTQSGVAVRKCLDKIAQLYSTGKSAEQSWEKKRQFGFMRIWRTISMTGPNVIASTLLPEELLLPIEADHYFKHIDASGHSYTTVPTFGRSNSQP